MSGPIAHVIPYLGCDFGGPVVAMAAMAAGLAELGEEVAVFSTHRNHEGARIELPPACRLVCTTDAGWGGLRHSPQLWAEVERAAPRLLHSHGLWTDVHRCAAAVARRRGVPHVIGPCGMLDAGALHRSAGKKRLALALFQRRALSDAACLLANSEQEVTDIRRFGLGNPVALVPNPVPGPALPVTADDAAGIVTAGKKTLLYLGRLHPVKGLPRLLAAWAQLTDLHAGWQLVLAGPDEGGWRVQFERQAAAAGCAASILWAGPLDERRKWAALAAADLFVMPSDFENFGMAIAEALLAGVPVVTTDGTPWQALVEERAGWQVARDPAALAAALREAMTLPDDERRARGARGRHLAACFSPARVAAQLRELYGWLSGAGERPGFVRGVRDE